MALPVEHLAGPADLRAAHLLVARLEVPHQAPKSQAQQVPVVAAEKRVAAGSAVAEALMREQGKSKSHSSGRNRA